jgi:DNA-directed RNA polymerase specialized sigma24 family protein
MEDRLAGRIVELHHLGGLTHEQVAEALGTTVYQVRLNWTYARAWLKAALENS